MRSCQKMFKYLCPNTSGLLKRMALSTMAAATMGTIGIETFTMSMKLGLSRKRLQVSLIHWPMGGR